MSQKVALVAGMVGISVREATPAEAAAFALDPTGERQAAREFVRHAIAIGAILLDPESGFTLNSGRKSPYFFKADLFNTGQSMSLLADAYAAVLYPHLDVCAPVVVYGPPYKGTLLAPAIVAALWNGYGVDAGFASSRKEAKDHGEGGVMLGHELAGAAVHFADDVISSGKSIEEAIALVRSKGGQPAGCIIALDRQERAREGSLSGSAMFFQKYGIPVRSAATRDDLIAVLEEDDPAIPLGPATLPAILQYRDQYGA